MSVERFDAETAPPESIDVWPKLQLVVGWRHGAYRISATGRGEYAAELQVPNDRTIVEHHDLEYAALPLGTHQYLRTAVRACRQMAGTIRGTRMVTGDSEPRPPHPAAEALEGLGETLERVVIPDECDRDGDLMRVP